MVTTATLQTIWDCRWSRPGYRVFGVQDHLQPEKLWVCVRRGERNGVTEEEDRFMKWRAGVYLAAALCLCGMSTCLSRAISKSTGAVNAPSARPVLP